MKEMKEMKERLIITLALAFVLLPTFSHAATVATTCPNLSRNLSFGSRGTDVIQLQSFLISQKDLATGNNTGYYGRLTQSAVQSFQRRNNIVSSGTPATTGYGVVGRKTRAAIARSCASPNPVTPTFPAPPPAPTPTPSPSPTPTPLPSPPPTPIPQPFVPQPLSSTPFFHSYAYAPGIVREIRDTGIHTYNIDTNIFGDDVGFTKSVSIGPDTWDFSALTDTMALILKEDPQAKFVLRLAAGSPEWYRNQVPDVLLRAQNGSPGNQPATDIAYMPIRAKWTEGISKLRDALLDKAYENLIIAFVLVGESSQEWINFDHLFNVYGDRPPLAYSTAHRAGFRQWTLTTYGTPLDVPTEAQFRAASFIGNGSRSVFLDPKTDDAVIKYYLYRSELTADTIVALARSVRGVFPGRPVGAIYGYMNEFGGNPTSGHNSLKHLLEASNGIDFINPMSSYLDRAFAGADFERQPVTSVTLNGKMVFNDLDQGTYLSKRNYENWGQVPFFRNCRIQ